MTDVTPDQQAMWDALGILGFDLDGDRTPAATLVSGGQSFREYFIRSIHEARADHDAAIDELTLPKRPFEEAHPDTQIGRR